MLNKGLRRKWSRHDSCFLFYFHPMRFPVLVHREMEFRPVGVDDILSRMSRHRAAKVCRFGANPGAVDGQRVSPGPSNPARPRPRSWPLGRRSGCSSAEPYPPPRPASFVARPSSSRNLTRISSSHSTTLTCLLQLAVALGEDFLLQADQLVGRCHVAQRAVQSRVVVMVNI